MTAKGEPGEGCWVVVVMPGEFVVRRRSAVVLTKRRQVECRIAALLLISLVALLLWVPFEALANGGNEKAAGLWAASPGGVAEEAESPGGEAAAEIAEREETSATAVQREMKGDGGGTASQAEAGRRGEVVEAAGDGHQPKQHGDGGGSGDNSLAKGAKRRLSTRKAPDTVYEALAQDIANHIDAEEREKKGRKPRKYRCRREWNVRFVDSRLRSRDEERGTVWRVNRSCTAPVFTFLVIVDPMAGSAEGLGERLEVDDENASSLAWIYQLGDQRAYDRLQLLVSMRRMSKLFFLPRVIVIGQDACVGHVINSIHRRGISLEHMALGIIPVGQGKDIANAMETERVLPEHHSSLPDVPALKKILKRFTLAYVAGMDVWETQMVTKQKGRILYRTGNAEAQVRLRACPRGKGEALPCLRWLLLGHFATGGVLSMVKPAKISSWKFPFRKLELLSHMAMQKTKWPSSTDVTDSIASLNGQQVPVETGWQSLVMMNSPSFMGSHNIWKLLGNEDGAQQHFSSQSQSDGQMEWVAFHRRTHVATTTLPMRSMCKRLAQSASSSLKFAEDLSRPVVYSIDGNVFEVLHPAEFAVANRITLKVMTSPVAQADEV